LGDEEAGALEVQVGGEIDLANAHALGGDLCHSVDRASERLIVDLSEVTFLDSSAMGMMLKVHNYAMACQKRVTWWNIQPTPNRAIKLMALDQVLDFAP